MICFSSVIPDVVNDTPVYTDDSTFRSGSPDRKNVHPFNVSNVTKILMLLLNNVSNIIQHIYGFYGKRSNVTNFIKVHHYFNVTTICSTTGLSCPKAIDIDIRRRCKNSTFTSTTHPPTSSPDLNTANRQKQLSHAGFQLSDHSVS